MRKNPYEKIRRTLFILFFILLVSAACVIGVMIVKNTHNAEKNKVRETTAVTEKATEKIKETEADTEYYFDEDGYLKVKKSKLTAQAVTRRMNRTMHLMYVMFHRKMIPMRSFRKPLMLRPDSRRNRHRAHRSRRSGRRRMQQPYSKPQEKRYDVRRKIANEFQRYFLSMMATSKENILHTLMKLK